MANLPLSDDNKTLWAYANVRYKLDEPITGAGYYYRIYTVDNFNLSSPIKEATPEQLKAAVVKVTEKPSLLIEDFKGDWQKDWFAYKPEKWELATHKIYSNKWKAPEKASLEFEVRCVESNVLVVSLDAYAKEIQIHGGDTWQKINLSPNDFINANGEILKNWKNVKEFKWSANQSFREKAEGQTQTMDLGTEGKGEKPEFRKLRWIEYNE
jgi:hypothetical protein